MIKTRQFALAAFALASIEVSNAAQVTAIVATRTIYPGQPVTADQVESISLDQCESCNPGFVIDTKSIVGKIASKTILPNRLIYPEALQSPAIIQKGVETTLIFRSGGLTISVKAIALADASAGAPVTVRSLLNGVIVSGLAQSDGSVLAGGS